MLFKLKDIIGLEVYAASEKVGTIKDIYFDDASWHIRYFIVDTGNWLSRNEVLLTPKCFMPLNAACTEIRTTLTKEQVDNSPPTTSDMPISRQYEEALHRYYDWIPYWSMPIHAMPGMYFYPDRRNSRTTASEPLYGKSRRSYAPQDGRHEHHDLHLRSFVDIEGRHTHAVDGELGHINDLLVDSYSWHLTHFIVDTSNWWAGHLVIVDLGAVKNITWDTGQVNFALTRQAIKDAPEYSNYSNSDTAFQSQLSKYYRKVGARCGLNKSVENVV